MSSGTGAGPAGRRSILFVAEAVTLAHVARPVALARGLDPAQYAITLACDTRYQAFLGNEAFRSIPVQSITSARFLENLAKGRRLYDTETLRGYVKADLALFERTSPELVIGDFRLSLSISARIAGIPYITITNAYWSPYARQRFPLPELPINRLFGLKLAGAVFRLVRPPAFAWHTLPLNRVRREYHLPGLGYDLRRTYTDADYTVYGDIPELMPTFDLPPSHHYLGAIGWSPACELPDWWAKITGDRPLIYVTLGSSGQSDLLPVILRALADLPVSVIVATAGRTNPDNIPANTRVADYLPGEQAAARASLVICNGGSLTTQQALVAGVPTLGIVSNMDQQLNMEAICRAGAGRLLRQSAVESLLVRSAVEAMLQDKACTEAATRLAGYFSDYNAQERFRRLVADALPSA